MVFWIVLATDDGTVDWKRGRRKTRRLLLVIRDGGSNDTFRLSNADAGGEKRRQTSIDAISLRTSRGFCLLGVVC